MELAKNDNDKDESAYWKQYYDDAQDSSFEVNNMHEEGEKLHKILCKAFPTDKRDHWSYRDVQQAVEASRLAWESKQRLGKGRPQKWFHSLMKKFDMHSTLFSIFPAGNTYASIVAGAATMLVTASVNHTNTIAALSDALDSISDAIALCDIDLQLIRSRPVKDAIAKLYKEVFSFFIGAAKWYQSSSLSKFRNSFHRDFAEQFNDSVSTIIAKAAAVRHAAQLGSQAEVRVTRLGVESLQKDFKGANVGLNSLAAKLDQQHDDVLKQHLTTQELIRCLNRLQSTSVSVSRFDEADTFLRGNEPVSVPWLTVREAADMLKESLTLRRIGSEDETQPGASQAMLRYQVATIINQWLANLTSPLLYLEHVDTLKKIGTEAVLAANIAHIIQLSNFQAASCVWGREHICEDDDDLRQQPPRDSILEMAMEIVTKLLKSLPDDQLLPGQAWESFASQKSTHDSSKSGLDILEESFQALNETFYLVITLQPDAFADADNKQVKRVISIFRSATARETSKIRVLLLTRQKIPSLIQHLHEDEVKLVISSAGAKLALLPVIMPASE